MPFGQDIAQGGIPVWEDDPTDQVVLNNHGSPASALTGEEAVWIGEGGSRQLAILGGGGVGGIVIIHGGS